MASLRRPKVGVFDSGVGGLTVLRALVERIPDADYLYFGDTARLPYGSKSAATVAHYAVGAVRYLQDQGADLLVIACNTATALALDEIKIKAAAGVEVLGVIEPGAEAAAAASRKQKVVVIGTEATISSHAYRRALEARKVAVREKACPLFVPLDVARELQVGTPPSTTNERRSPPQLKFFATDSAEKFRTMGTRFLGLPVEDVLHVDLKE